MTPDQNNDRLTRAFKALSNPNRLQIYQEILHKQVSEVSDSGCRVVDFINAMRVGAPTISHHLSKLADVGLLDSHKDQYYQMYSLIFDPLQKTLAEMVQLPQPDVQAAAETDAYRAKVLKTFMKHGRLTQIPSQLKKRMVVLEKMVQEFEPGRRYSEQEVNQLLLEFHEDVAFLRRELVDQGLMDRTNRGVYWRAEEE